MISYEFTVLNIVYLVIFFIITFTSFKLKINKFVLMTKILILTALMFFLLKPIYNAFRVKREVNVLFLIDTSYSMKVGNKIEMIKHYLNEKMPFFKNTNLKIMKFAETTDEVKSINEIKIERNNTDISQALLSADNSKPDHIFIFSDGFHNSPTNLNNIIYNLSAKVHPVVFEKWREYKDASIIEIIYPEVIFKNLPCEIVAQIQIIGYKDNEITILLEKSKEIISQTKKTIKNDISQEKVAFKFTPTDLGEDIYRISIVPLKGELSLSNNKKEFSIYTTREKIRVLYLCGRPSYEYFYIRNVLKNDPNIELVSFVILRNPENLAIAPDEELSLIPFPTHELFTRDLFDFDILVFENFTYTKFPITLAYLRNIVEFVRKGGAFLMIAGENSFGKGFYKNTPIEEILPVELEHTTDEFFPGFFKPKVINYEHPIIALTENKEKNKEIWSEMAEVEGVQKLRVKKTAINLLSHPSFDFTVLSVQEEQKGRVAAVGINTTWRWVLASSEKNIPFDPHQKFWRNLFYWLAKSPTVEPYKIILSKSKTIIGEPVNITVLPLAKELHGKKVMVLLHTPSKKIKCLELPFVENIWKYEFTPEEKGTHVFDFSSDFIKPEKRKYLHVTDLAYEEDENVGLNISLLEEIAKATAGKIISENELPEYIKTLEPRTKKEIVKQIQIWNSQGLFLVLLLLLTSELLIRRLFGYH